MKLATVLFVVLIVSISNVDARKVVVERGESVKTLAKRYKTTPKYIIQANNLKPPYRLYVGQPLHIPVATNIEVGRRPIPIIQIPSAKPKIQQTTDQILKPEYPKPKIKPTLRIATSTHIKPLIKPAWLIKKKAKQPKPPKPRSKEMALTFVWPVKGKIISRFGTKKKGLRNDGININAPVGTPVKAAESGIVAYAGNELRGFGNLILLKHKDGWMSAYAHADKIKVKKGQKVKRGQAIATAGATGHVDEPQLHFELRHKTRTVDPAKYLV